MTASPDTTHLRYSLHEQNPKENNIICPIIPPNAVNLTGDVRGFVFIVEALLYSSVSYADIIILRLGATTKYKALLQTKTT